MQTIKEFVKTHLNEMIIGKKVNQKGIKHMIQGVLLIGKKLELRVGFLENENIGLRQVVEKLQNQNKNLMDLVPGKEAEPKSSLTIKEGNS